MHGRPRKPAKAEDSGASAAKAEKLRTLQNQLLYNHHNHIYTKEALEVSSKLLEVNPEVYTAWNYRKLAFQCNLQSLSDHNALKSVLNEELRVAEIALRRNPKCYGAWHHRKWVMQRDFSLINHDYEFQLLDQLLKADSRNFHGWNHRRFVAALKNMKEEDELQFTTDKINANFSNYSAWHNRSVLLSHLLKRKDPGFLPRKEVLAEEFELVHQALFTDPEDQSGWFYYLWLLDQTINSEGPQLISSWPSQGSDLIFSVNGKANNWTLLPVLSSHSVHVPHGGTFPIVLCFNKAVMGVNSSTVIVQSMLIKNEDLHWRPLSTTNLEEAYCWITYLKIPMVKCSLSESYPFEVSLGHSPGIISSSGSHYAYPSRFGFTLVLNSVGSEHTKEELDMNTFTWKDDNFYIIESPLLESLISGSFKQLRISKEPEPASSKWQTQTLLKEIALFRELLSEINCKIAKLTLARLLVALDAVKASGGPAIRMGTYSDEVLELYDDLMKLDPTHMRYYLDERSLVLVNQVTSDKESIAKHCWQHKKITSCLHYHVYLRLNKLSLSRIGFVERFLWVRVLDLSHNELQSIEGLEVLQILSCLNLSNNKISSFTALEPLKLIYSLRVLDVSYNKIGSHSIDTTRYLCTSPLSHNVECTSNVLNSEKDSIKESDYWEAILVLKDQNLAQLDTRGNAISTDAFRMLMVELLPTLKWFDGALV